ncbi:MAG: hypothetical protein DCC52_02160 [Chloroflexi bacterium]|nr:MAG: hypothetical protein DCC52_02160 [Chloroflexota bacterium]
MSGAWLLARYVSFGALHQKIVSPGEEKIMSRKFTLLCALALGLWFIGCTSNATPTPPPTPLLPVPTATPPNNDPTWDRIQTSKIWRIGTSGNYAPFSFYNDKNELDGFDVQLGKALAEQIGLTAEYTDFAFEGLGGAMRNGQIDGAIAAISVTPERQQEFDFSNVYFSGEDGVLASKDANVRINSLDDFARYRVGVQSGAVYQTYLEQSLVATGQMLESNVFVYSDLNAAINDVILKRIDVVWMDLKPAQDFADQRGLRVVDRSLYPQFFAIAMPKKRSRGSRANISNRPSRRPCRCRRRNPRPLSRPTFRRRRRRHRRRVQMVWRGCKI